MKPGDFDFGTHMTITPELNIDTEARHEGVAWLERDIDTDLERLVGYYYTDRKTSGDLAARRVTAMLSGEPSAASKRATKARRG